MTAPLQVAAVDYHTGGELFRIVSGGVPPLQGATVRERRRWAAAHLDHVRQLLVNEPRGHADAYGGFVTPPDDDGADLGVVFFHNEGYSTACGHGTIALVTWALESGYVAGRSRPDGTVEVVVDVPSGRLPTTASRGADGRVDRVRFRNVPAYVEATGRTVATPLGTFTVDVAFGGAFYAVLDVAQADADVTPSSVERLIAVGRAIKDALNAGPPIVHPEVPDLADIYGVIFVEELREDDRRLAQRNLTVFADGEVDRSPTGSGTSARLALLDASGRLGGRTLENHSVVGSVFEGEVVGTAAVAGRPAVVTEVVGSAHLSAWHTFVLEVDDELGTGFLLR